MLAAILILTSVSFVFADSTYTVKSGDVLWKIAQKNNTTWQQLAEINKLKNPHLIFPNQVLKLQADATASASVKENAPVNPPAAPVVSGSAADSEGKLSFKAGTYTAEAKGIRPLLNSNMVKPTVALLLWTSMVITIPVNRQRNRLLAWL
jgi:murein DD-endopeptidase MepM/ murein hydrolase activator NlpD